MSNPRILAAGAVITLLSNAAAFAEPRCEGNWIDRAAALEGLVFGDSSFERRLSDDLVFTLLPDVMDAEHHSYGPPDLVALPDHA